MALAGIPVRRCSGRRSAGPALPFHRLLPAASAALALAASGARAAPVASVAILDVATQGTFDPQAVAGLADVVAAEAARRPLRVVSRSDLAALLGFERQRQLLGCGDAACLAEIGGALGVDFLLATQVGRVGGVWLVTVALLDARGARPAVRAMRRAEKDRELVEAAAGAVAGVLSDDWIASLRPPAPRGPRRAVIAGASLLAAGLAVGGVGLWHYFAARSAGNEADFEAHRKSAAWLEPAGDALGLVGLATIAGGAVWMKLAAGSGGDAPGLRLEGRF